MLCVKFRKRRVGIKTKKKRNAAVAIFLGFVITFSILHFNGVNLKQFRIFSV